MRRGRRTNDVNWRLAGMRTNLKIHLVACLVKMLARRVSGVCIGYKAKAVPIVYFLQLEMPVTDA